MLKAHDFLLTHDGSDPNETVEALCALAEIEIQSGRLDRAEADHHQAQSTLATAKRNDSAIVEAELSRIRLLQGDGSAAFELGREARDHAVKIEGERSYDTATLHYRLRRRRRAHTRTVRALTAEIGSGHPVVSMIPRK